MEHFDILIVGGGAAGIAAAQSAYAAGSRSIALVDRKHTLGGILLQCLHRGFGQQQNGPEYTASLLQGFPPELRFFPDTTVVGIGTDRTACLSGGSVICFQQLILATGCREIPLGALPITGSRPNGVYTAGQMQEQINLRGQLPQGPVVILGSGDLGLILADHLAEAGLSVTLVEQKSTCGGMVRNRRCLQRYPIHLICNATVESLSGEKELESCTLSTGEILPCATLLIAAGLRPDRELILDLGDPDWLQCCGNCSRVHPMVESVVNEGKLAGQTAVQKIRGSI